MTPRIVGIGEVLWDLLPAGRQMGGAPANVICHAAMMGADTTLVSRVGSDELGREIAGNLRSIGVRTDCLQSDAERPTGTVGVELDVQGQPRFTIHEDVAWDRIADHPSSRAAIAAAQAICFGTLARRSEPSRSCIRSLLHSASPASLRLLDVNLRPPFNSFAVIAEALADANALKINDDELPRLAELFHLAGDVRSQIRQIAEEKGLRLVALTRGAHGSLLYLGGQWSDHPGVPVKVVDAVGAGDSFTATLILGTLAGWDLDRVNQQANQVAAYVCSHPGATPSLPPRFREAFAS